MVIPWTIQFKFKELLVLLDESIKTRTIIINESLSLSDFLPDVRGIDSVKLSENISITQKHWLQDVVPGIEVFIWDPEEISPSGYRHIPAGNTFLEKATDFGTIDFGIQDHSPGTSPTRVATIKVATESGVFSIMNLRVWQNKYGLGSGDLSINYDVTSDWIQGRSLASGDGSIMPTSLPSSQNVFRWDGNPIIEGNGGDASFFSGDENVSEYIYMSINTSSVYDEGKYGPSYLSDVGIRITYDYFIGTD